MEAARWCLYLPGICMHAVPASRRPGSGDLRLQLDPFPEAFKFQPIPNPQSVARHYTEAFPTPSSPSDPLFLHDRASTSSAGSSTRTVELTGCEKAFENTSTSVAASQMRNALTALADTCKDPHQREVSLLFAWLRSLIG